MGKVKRLSITFIIIVLTAVLSIRLASLFASPNSGLKAVFENIESPIYGGEESADPNDKKLSASNTGYSKDDIDNYNDNIRISNKDNEDNEDNYNNDNNDNSNEDNDNNNNDDNNKDNNQSNKKEGQEKTEADDIPPVNQAMLDAQKGQEEDAVPAPASATKVAKTVPDPITG